MRRAFPLTLMPVPLVIASSFGIGPAPRSAPAPADTLPGRWELRPIAVGGMTAPGMGGTFDRFSQFAWIPGREMLVFWAHVRDGDGDWGLYSWKNGELRNVLVERRRFRFPDGHEMRILRPYNVHPARLIASSRAVYYRTSDRLYTWDGDRFTRVVGESDTLVLSGVSHVVKGLGGADDNFRRGPETDGSLLLRIRSERPRQEWVWAVHDGIKLTPLVVEGDPVPTHPGGVWREVIATQAFGDTVLAWSEFEAPRRRGLFRHVRGTVTHLADERHRDASGREFSLRDTWSCGPDSQMFWAAEMRDNRAVAPYLMLGRPGTSATIVAFRPESPEDSARWVLASLVPCPAGRGGALMSWVRWTEVRGGRLVMDHALVYHDRTTLTRLPYSHRDTVNAKPVLRERAAIPMMIERALADRHPLIVTDSLAGMSRAPFAPAHVVPVGGEGYLSVVVPSPLATGGSFSSHPGQLAFPPDWITATQLELRALGTALGGVLATRVARPDQAYVVDFSGSAPVLRPAPVALTDSGAVSIAGAVGWTGSNSAILALSSGFYELRRQ